MPPGQLLKASRTKMQAWVTNNGLSNSQPSPSAYDGSGIPQKHQHAYDLGRQQYEAQPTPPLTQQESPPRSRAPIVNANSTRAAAVQAARLPVPSLPVPSGASHGRNTSLNLPRGRAISSEPLSSSATKGQKKFWEGSTVDGSLFSETASNVDASTAATSHRRVALQAPLNYQQRDPPRHRPVPVQQEVNRVEQHPPFVIGRNGLIDVIANPLTRSASTPDARSQRGSFKEATPEPNRDQYYDQYTEDNTSEASPEKTPSAKRLHHPKAFAMRTARPDSISERTTYPHGDTGMSSSPQKHHAYDVPDGPYVEVPPEQPKAPEHLRLKVPTQEAHRSTVFADTDTPMVSHPDESDSETIDQPPTPKPIPKAKPQVSRQPQVNRILFGRDSEGQIGLHQSAMPRAPVEKRQPVAKKRHYETDYDDSALAAMNYAKLKQEAFDHDPAQAEARSVVGPPQGTLPQKLDHFFNKDESSQMEFFSKMPVREWEDSGDWLLERFGEVMNRLKAARKDKRAMMENFEDEIATREEQVRGKIDYVDTKLVALKSEGEGMMKGVEYE
ncbi:Uu.00g016670.m01.CDS01 [Anthostomella pinea]|uniref:Uu.00g016670.m01.CDS01 n=1 Tax=Anthostomella pinea TaxID=933095 RepID=A0AAI8YQG9_9PEZI|nr:Uu.00g016670.m01.CDS01 [Anthostomella pinea]